LSKNARLAHREAARLAAQLHEQKVRQRRRMAAIGSVAVVVMVLVVLVVVKLSGGSAGTPSRASSPASNEVIDGVTKVPASVLDQIGLGKVDTLPKAITGQPALISDNKPLVLYVGAEYCPFCAAQRWGMVVALSRFGTFANLATTQSSSSDIFPNTATLSFHGVTYTSQYLAFQGVETETNQRVGQGYGPLDQLTNAQQQVFNKYNAPPYVTQGGAIPFIDFGNQYVIAGASVSPQLFAGKEAQDIAGALSDPNSSIAKAVDGSANAFTAIICKLTGGQPGDVCTSPGVAAYQGKI
jgi:uncharacterized protein DUF929